MTTIALKGFALSFNFLKGIVNFFNGVTESIAVSRQFEANRRVAQYLKHEYPGLTEMQIVSELDAKTIKNWGGTK
jgi:hypothetical protein